MAMSTIKEQLGAYLSGEGMQPSDKPYGFHFEFEDLSFHMFWDVDDERYMSLTLPGIFDVDENNREDALCAANKVNDNIKVVKAIVREDDVWVVSEFLIDKDPKFGDMIPRMINMLKNARVAFYDAIKNL